jgi:CHAD domain-containing protein
MKVREREIKFIAPTGFELPPLTDVGGDVFAGAVELLDLEATYYDTPDLRLARSGATVRHRNNEGWVVKLPRPLDGDGVLTRDEHHFDGKPDELPADVVDLVRALIRRSELEPVATLQTARRRVEIHDASGAPIAEVVDDRVMVLDGPSNVPSFREVEVELTDRASTTQRMVLVARLRAAGASEPDPTPKLVRALGRPAEAPPEVVVPRIDGHRHPRADDVVRYAIAASVAKLVYHDPGVRLGDEPEDIHQARVATRRLRSHLHTFRSLVDEHWANHLRDELSWLADVLGGVRDAEVLLERLEAKIGRLPEPDRGPANRLIDTLRADREERRILLLDALRSERYTTLIDALVEAARRPRLPLRIGDEDDDVTLRGVVRRPWEQLRKAVDALDDDPPDDDLHNVRIRAKRARYAAEAVEPAFGKPARQFARAVTAVQDALGEHQDAVIAAEWLRRAAARTHDESVGFAAGQLAAFEHIDALAARAAWSAPWETLTKKRVSAWLL